jgi:hypothetical protein
MGRALKNDRGIKTKPGAGTGTHNRGNKARRVSSQIILTNRRIKNVENRMDEYNLEPDNRLQQKIGGLPELLRRNNA